MFPAVDYDQVLRYFVIAARRGARKQRQAKEEPK
jgi:hypothetical protein